MDDTRKGTLSAIAAAALYALSSPFSKMLLSSVDPAMLSSLLYLGAGLGMSLLGLAFPHGQEEKLSRNDLPATIMMVVLDIIAPMLMMVGLSGSSAASASLLGNFEIVATALFATFAFKEKISGRLWTSIILVTIACALLSCEGRETLRFSPGSLLVVLAASIWGLENNCTRVISGKDPLEIVVIKGFGSGFAAFLIARLRRIPVPPVHIIVLCLLLGFLAYGLSIFMYVRAQRYLGAARTSAWYAIAPFLACGISLAAFRAPIPHSFWLALPVMALGSFFAVDQT